MIDPTLLPPGYLDVPPENQRSNNAPNAFPQPSGLDFVALIAQAARAANGDRSLATTSPAQQEALVGPESAQSSRPRRSKRTIASTNATTDLHGEDDGPPAKRRRSRKKSGDSDNEAEPKKRASRRGRRKSTAAADDNDSEQETLDGEPRKKRRGRKARSPVRFDADADPGEELDPTVVTMADLCEDTGQGRVSSKAAQIFDNHANWKRANRERRARMRAISERKKYGLKDDEGEGEGEQAANKGEPEEVAVPGSPPAEVEEDHFGAFDADADGEAVDDEDDFDYSAVGGGSKFAPRFRIGPNGETIIDDTSLHVDRDEEAETAGYQHVEESDATKFTNSSTYGKKVHGSRWSAEETEMFFDALRQFGENYELISYVLPGRDRKQCKNKFKSEDKKNSARIDECLKNRTAIDMETLSRLTGKDFSGPTPVIRAKTPPNLAGMDPSAAAVADDTSTVRKQSSTPGPSEKAGKRAGKKKANAKADDGVEILGAADGVWDSD
ncbi:hypothetical protein PENSPDRAFT_572482 [Peniophora sp. CONT]|nr:hypothetical protein PENSPDRAFT_572482 [Peniophora sp. CONT]